MSAGMGEGWSDFYARSLLSTADEDPTGIYASGGWVTYQLAAGYTDNYYYGIRRFPYASHQHGRAERQAAQPADLRRHRRDRRSTPPTARFRATRSFADTAFEVHNIGEVWAMALLEVRARFITRLGWAAGNQRILQFVTDGMKLDPVNPTLLQGRDSILAAADCRRRHGGRYRVDIWAGFAARGMGVQATFDPLTFFAGESFNVPGGALPSVSINDVSVTEGNGGTTNATFTVTLANPGSLASTARVTWATADGSATTPGTTVTSPTTISIPSSGASTPYPSTLVVAGLPASIGHLRVRLNAVSHTFPADIDALLVGPGGQKVMLMSGAWNAFSSSPATLTFEDGAQRPPLLGAPVTGTYSPANYSETSFPAPAGPYGTALSAFNGTNPNGTWSLYVFDNSGGDSGTISGFSLVFSAPTDDYLPSSGQLVFPIGGPATQTVSVPINGDGTTEGNETFVVNLSAAIGTAISDAQGLGTILNDDGLTPPTVVTGAATSITSTWATLNGTVNPNGLDTTAWFQYGTTTSYTATTTFQAMGAGICAVADWRRRHHRSDVQHHVSLPRRRQQRRLGRASARMRRSRPARALRQR